MTTVVATENVVVVDTSVYSELFLQADSKVIPLYTEHLRGKRFVLPFMVAAEMRFWAMGLGGKRRDLIEQKMHEAAKEGLSDELITAYITLQRDCQKGGHGLFQKEHVADRWIAATAIFRGLPLVAHDRVFIDAPGLHLITELT